MDGRVLHRVFSRSLFLAGMLLVLLLVTPGYGETPEGPKNVDVTTKDLQELVDLLENPERREAFVKDLKNLIGSREGCKTS